MNVIAGPGQFLRFARPVLGKCFVGKRCQLLRRCGNGPIKLVLLTQFGKKRDADESCSAEESFPAAAKARSNNLVITKFLQPRQG